MWVAALEQPITDVVFQRYVYEQIGAFPELILITDAFRADFSTGAVIDEVSRQMLSRYLTERVRPLLLARVNAGMKIE
jgi:hypothetical protein